MNAVPSGVDYGGAHFYRDRDDLQTFYYIAGEPKPDTDASGKPALNFFVTDNTALLQFSTRWEVPVDVFEASRKPLHEQFPDSEPASMRFSPAPLLIKAVTLALTDKAQEEDLQTVTSANFPPYSALFNVTLTPEQKSRVASALNGRTGVLKVSYVFSLSTNVSVETSITGDVSKDIAELGSSPARSDCQARIDTAIAEDRLRVVRKGAEGAPPELIKKVDGMAKEKAIDILQRMAKQAELNPDVANLKATATATMPTTIPLSRSTDVGSWYAAGSGAKVTVAPSTNGTIAERKGTPCTIHVAVGFNLKDLPVAFVQLSWASEQATIRPPMFNPVTLNGQTDKPLAVKTFYTDGGPPYETRVVTFPANELKLTPSDMGLVQVAIDASARRKAGATQAKINVSYEPARNGTSNEHLTSFRFGDWTDSWYVVTRSSDLGGTLKINRTETLSDGSVVTPPTVTTDKTAITL
jgi:hypothetical protein